MNFDMGIYTITSPSGGAYVGSAMSFKKRWKAHLCRLRLGTHHSPALQRAFKKYGESALVFAKVAFCSKSDLLMREQEQIDARCPRYNVLKEAGQPPMKGRRHTAESRAKMSAALKGRKMEPRSPEHRANLAKANRGKTPSVEVRAKLSRMNKGKKHTEEARAKISEAGKGRIFSAESREKKSRALKGRRQTAEHRENQSKARSTTGYRGVAKHGKTGRWRAYAYHEGKQKSLGVFLTPELASESVQTFLRSLHEQV